MHFPHLHDISGHLMPHNRRVVCHIFMNPFMLHSENRTFMGGHTYTVRNHFHQDLVLFNLWQFKFVHPKVIGPVQPDCRYFHNTLPDLIRFRQLLFSKQFTLVHKIIVSKVLIIVSTVFILVNYCNNSIYILFFCRFKELFLLKTHLLSSTTLEKNLFVGFPLTCRQIEYSFLLYFFEGIISNLRLRWEAD